MVIAAEIPVRDQPVASAIGVSSTGSENIAPIATQPITPPAATITHRYAGSAIYAPLRQRAAAIATRRLLSLDG